MKKYSVRIAAAALLAGSLFSANLPVYAQESDDAGNVSSESGSGEENNSVDDADTPTENDGNDQEEQNTSAESDEVEGEEQQNDAGEKPKFTVTVNIASDNTELPLTGASFDIIYGSEDCLEADEAAFYTIDDDAARSFTAELSSGTYMLRNTAAAQGYDQADAILFQVTDEDMEVGMICHEADTAEYDEYVMQHAKASISLASNVTVPGHVSIYNDGTQSHVISTGDSRVSSYALYGSTVENGENKKLSKSRNILNRNSSLAHPIVFFSQDTKEDDSYYTFGDELLAWGQANGYDWDETTELSNVSLSIDTGSTFTNNGEPAELLDLDNEETILNDPHVEYCWKSSGKKQVQANEADSEYEIRNTQSVYHLTGIQLTADQGDSFAFNQFPSLELKLTLLDIQKLTINSSYYGNVDINVFLNFNVAFTVNGEEYHVALKLPEISPSFEVEDTDRHLNAVGGDIKATVQFDSENEEYEPITMKTSENDSPVSLMRGDTINYAIDISGEAERQMLTWLYSSLTITDVDAGTVDGTAYSAYFGRWAQPCFFSLNKSSLYDTGTIANYLKPRIKVKFQLPEDGVEYSDELLDQISIHCSKPDVVRWGIVHDSIKYNEATRTISMIAYMNSYDLPQSSKELQKYFSEEDKDLIKDIGEPGNVNDESRELIDRLLAALKGNEVEIRIPGVKVAENAKSQKRYTAKATISGNMSYNQYPYECIVGTIQPADTENTASDPEETEETDDPLSETDSYQRPELTEEQEEYQENHPILQETYDHRYSGLDNELWTSDMYEPYLKSGILDLRNYDYKSLAFGEYYWDYIQTPEGRDYTQTEEQANTDRELWFTFEIPETVVAKKVESSDEADYQKKFPYILTVEDEELKNENYSAAKVTVNEDGTRSMENLIIQLKNGEGRFTLKNNQSIYINLLFGTKYKITEDVKASDYRSVITDPSHNELDSAETGSFAVEDNVFNSGSNEDIHKIEYVTSNVTHADGTSTGTSTGSSSSGGAAASAGKVTVTADSNGTVKTSTSKPEAGDTVNITAEPKTGYTISTISVTDSSKKTVEVKAEDDGTFSYTEPEGGASVKVTFAKAAKTYRLYNPNSGEHVYTLSEEEKSNLVKAGWKDEAVAWTVPEKSDTPIYRVYNPNAGEHHYTTSKDEVDMLVKAGWKDEGIVMYSSPSGKVKVYRLYNPNAFANNHHYTVSKTEKDHLVSLGWKDEGVGWLAAE